jgi:hypothetical protein
MSNITVQGNASGSGIITLESPNTNSNRTVTLPDETGTLLTSVSSTIAFLAADQTFTGANRGTVTTDNDGSFDMNATNNFLCTPTGTVTLTFTNITAGQSGNIILVNGSTQSDKRQQLRFPQRPWQPSLQQEPTGWHISHQMVLMCMWLTRRLSHEP